MFSELQLQTINFFKAENFISKINNVMEHGQSAELLSQEAMIDISIFVQKLNNL